VAKARTPGRPLKALLVLPWGDGCWVREYELPFPPFQGLGIRLDVYEVMNVESVVVGDPGYDVTCIVAFDEMTPADRKRVTDDRIRALGFEEGGYP